MSEHSATVPDMRIGSFIQQSDDNAQGDKTKHERVIKQAKDDFKVDLKWAHTARRNFIEDIKFANADAYNGFQWPNDIRRNRDVDERPCLTINKTRQHNLMIINDSKKNKPAIKIRATGNGATAESASMYNAIMRNIEYRSNAQAAYDTASTFQVNGGIGWLRVITRYVSEDTFDQEPIIVRMNDPLNVVVDSTAKESDKSDMTRAFIFEDVPKDTFKSKYPDYADIAAAQNVVDDDAGWINKDFIRTCEYFRKVEERDVLYAYNDKKSGQTVMFRKSVLEEAPELLKQIQSDPRTKSRETSTTKIEWYFIVGAKIVDEAIWPGKFIPLIPVIGEETVIDGIMDLKGHTRALLDPQRIYNYWSPLSLNTPLPTPDGWTTMGETRVGDWLLDEKGKPVEVVGVSPIHLHRKCYRVEFDDGSHIIADGEHKWTVEERGKAIAGGWQWLNKTVSTTELTPKKHFIYATKPLELEEPKLPIHPYFLGVWLGDGASEAIRITSGFDDVDEMRDNIIKCGYNVGLPSTSGVAATIPVYGLLETFRNIGLIGNKHIPNSYLRASHKQRLELLRGLMDTDGSFGMANNQCSFTTVSLRIADGFGELLRTLGIKSIFCKRPMKTKVFPNGETYTSQEAFQFSFTADPSVGIFKLERKLSPQVRLRRTHERRTKRHRIKSVIEVSSVPVKCVTINSESHLFLAGEGMIPTHNSAAVEYGALQSKSPWTAAAEAIEGYETYWETANKVNHSVLPYNGLNDAGEPIPPPQRVQPPVAAPVALTGMQIASGEFMMASGQYQDSMGERSNERSGKAINERQRQGDTATYHFIDNLAIAIRQVGRILLDLIPKLYDTQRVMRIQAEDGVDFELEIDPQAQQVYQKRLGHDGQVAQHILNPSVGMYEVEADIGPSWGTKREEAFNALTLILTQAPQLTSLIGDLLLKSSDFDLSDEAAARLRRMVPAQALGQGPTPSEMQAQQQLQQTMQLLQKTMEELSREKLKGHDKSSKHVIDSYKAFTERLKVFLDDKARAAEAIDPNEIKALVKQTIDEGMEAHLGEDAEQNEQEANAGSSSTTTVNGAQTKIMDAPPVPGARRGADGHWYVKNYAKSPGAYSIVS